MAGLRKAPGMRERRPGVWELIVQAGRDPLTGRHRQVSRIFEGSLREAKAARARLLVEVQQGRHVGTQATLDDLCTDWLIELKRKDRSPTTVREYERRYQHDIQPTLGSMHVSKVTTKMLTDLYGAHQQRGQSAASVRKIHATLSSMMSQACRWGWRDSNPAEWAEPPPLGDELPVVPEPGEVLRLIEGALVSKRPVYAKVIFFAATTGARRGEVCALRRSAINWDRGVVRIDRNIVRDDGRLVVRPTKNRRRRAVALDERTLRMLGDQLEAIEERASAGGVELVSDAFVFTDSLTGSDPWDPDAVSQYFGRLRTRLGLNDLTFKTLRRFMDTYGQELGFPLAQVAVRAGHDPAVAAKHYTGRVTETDRALASAISKLLQTEGL